MSWMDDLRIPKDRKWGGEHREKYLSKIKNEIPSLINFKKCISGMDETKKQRNFYFIHGFHFGHLEKIIDIIDGRFIPQEKYFKENFSDEQRKDFDLEKYIELGKNSLKRVVKILVYMTRIEYSIFWSKSFKIEEVSENRGVVPLDMNFMYKLTVSLSKSDKWKRVSDYRYEECEELCRYLWEHRSEIFDRSQYIRILEYMKSVETGVSEKYKLDY